MKLNPGIINVNIQDPALCLTCRMMSEYKSFCLLFNVELGYVEDPDNPGCYGTARCQQCVRSEVK